MQEAASDISDSPSLKPSLRDWQISCLDMFCIWDWINVIMPHTASRMSRICPSPSPRPKRITLPLKGQWLSIQVPSKLAYLIVSRVNSQRPAEQEEVQKPQSHSEEEEEEVGVIWWYGSILGNKLNASNAVVTSRIDCPKRVNCIDLHSTVHAEHLQANLLLWNLLGCCYCYFLCFLPVCSDIFMCCLYRRTCHKAESEQVQVSKASSLANWF